MDADKQTALVHNANYDHDETINKVEADFVDDDNENAKRARELRRRVDYRLIPVLTLLYLLSYIDRSNSKPYQPSRNPS